jgi:hypothetical protein
MPKRDARLPAPSGDLRVSRGTALPPPQRRVARPQCHCSVVARFTEDGELSLEVTSVTQYDTDPNAEREEDKALMSAVTYTDIPENLRERAEKALRAVLEDAHDACAETVEDAAVLSRAQKREYDRANPIDRSGHRARLRG